MEVIEINNIIYEGELQGIVTSTVTRTGFSQGYAFLSFIIKLDKRLEGIPEELPVFGGKTRHSEYLINTHVREGDIVKIYGKIIQNWLKHWKRDVIWIRAEHIFNETLNFGY